MEILQRKALIVGISGASCSGKTTLAKLLQHVFPNVLILHQDDFFKDETEYTFIPYTLQNFDPHLLKC
jgi:nicotinamide/nicotinate riboside kinase